MFNPTPHGYPGGGAVRTTRGAFYHPLTMSKGDLHIFDIASALANINRFGGHSLSAISVGWHSICVANLLAHQFGDPTLTHAGLLHDAAEAYIGDMVRPLKHSAEMAAFRAAEAHIDRLIAERWGVVIDDPRVKAADDFVLTYEMGCLRDSTLWSPPSPHEVRRVFLAMHQHLAQEVAVV